jgi:hypothetical protein
LSIWWLLVGVEVVIYLVVEAVLEGLELALVFQ